MFPRLEVALAFVVDPGGDRVFGFHVCRRGVDHRLPGSEALGLPFDAALDEPLRMPGHSAFNFSVNSWSRSSGGMVTANGMR